ncbi:MAG: permease-like cell division protein FtsX [Defluviitaleaceae bacterium]|nr:permease-like cell division protein FtsX [Defluviitaleaceae bacterium]MCL2263536.1 permease-like cell division protein FtsX [Defluviitaleaceae bacterium]
MKPRTIKYYIHEAIRSIIYNRFMSVASIFAVASSIFIVAVFYIIGANVEYFMNQLESQMGMAVRIDENISPAEQQRLEQRIREIRNVADISFVCRDEALENMERTLGEDAVRGLSIDNPLRDSFIVELTDLAFHDEVEHAITNLRPYGVAQIDSDAEFARTLTTISRIVHIISAILVIILAGISIIIITNTIRITVNARKTEINIMKYVGATDWFIRWPFVLEGMLIGLLGGAVPALICSFGYGRVIGAINEIPMLAWVSFMPEEHIMQYVFPFSLALGVIIGLIGSVTSVKKHLKV